MCLDQDCRTKAGQERFASYRLNVFKAFGGVEAWKGRVVLNIPFACLSGGVVIFFSMTSLLWELILEEKT